MRKNTYLNGSSLCCLFCFFFIEGIFECHFWPILTAPQYMHCCRAAQGMSGRADDIAQSAAASYSFLLACILLSTPFLK